MAKGIIVRLTGANVSETAQLLVERLAEMGYAAELVDAAKVERLGGAEAASDTCRAWTHGVIVVIATCADAALRGECLPIEIDANDTPDFAVEKIIDALGAAGVVALEESGYTPEEEEQIRQRLAGLGYIE